jgi:hypothetical protein
MTVSCFFKLYNFLNGNMFSGSTKLCTVHLVLLLDHEISLKDNLTSDGIENGNKKKYRKQRRIQ